MPLCYITMLLKIMQNIWQKCFKTKITPFICQVESCELNAHEIFFLKEGLFKMVFKWMIKKLRLFWIENHQGLCYHCFHFCA